MTLYAIRPAATAVEGLFEANDTEDVLWSKLAAFVRETYGVSSMMYAFTHSKFTVSRTGIMPSIYFRNNFPLEYLNTFAGGFTLDDGVAAWLLLEGRTPLFWSDFPDMDLTGRQRRRIAEDQACGMGVGISFGFRFGANSGIAALCLAAQHDDPAAFKARLLPRLDELERLGTAFDALMRPAMVANRLRLTPREKDVLSYSAGGMTTKQIAKHLDLSPKTVANTLERARKSLGAVSTMEAVAKALIYELIL